MKINLFRVNGYSLMELFMRESLKIINQIKKEFSILRMGTPLVDYINKL
jgi:hypothetical protein